MAKGYQVTVQTLNVRSGPGTQYDDLDDVHAGDVLIPVTDWIPIQFEDGTVGWVSRDFVTEVELDTDVSKPAPEPHPGVGEAIYQSQLQTLYGKPRDPAPYLKTMDFAEFKNDLGHVRDWEGNPWSCRIYGHEMMEAPLRQAFRNLIERGYAGEWRTYEGCLSIRQMTGGNGYSTHAWGMAIDLNAGSNQYGQEPTLSAEFVKCFTDAGFTWGGFWNTPDGMHFQLPRIK